jgi:hypothetical protein
MFYKSTNFEKTKPIPNSGRRKTGVQKSEEKMQNKANLELLKIGVSTFMTRK